MKNNSIKKPFVLISIILYMSMQFANGQLNVQNNSGNYWGSMDFTLTNPPEAIGIGNFSGATPIVPAASLHINTNTYTPTFFNAGEVFRPARPCL